MAAEEAQMQVRILPFRFSVIAQDTKALISKVQEIIGFIFALRKSRIT